MAMETTINYESILKTIRSWPVSSQLTLMQDVLRSMEDEIQAKPKPKNTLEKALGLLATDSPPPTDEEVEQWLHERRMEKYG